MDYRKRYFQKIVGNQEHPKQIEEKIIIEKNEERPSLQNEYLHKLLEKTKDIPQNKPINLSSVDESLPFFKSNVRDILSKEENKQRAIKYIIRKRREERHGRSPIVTRSDEEDGEFNPVLTNRNNNNNIRNLNDMSNAIAFETNKKEKITNNINNETIRPLNSKSYYKKVNYAPKQDYYNPNIFENNNRRKERIEPYNKRKTHLSTSINNINNFQNNNIENQDYNINNSVYLKRIRNFDINLKNQNINNNDISENKIKNGSSAERQPYGHILGPSKRYENDNSFFLHPAMVNINSSLPLTFGKENIRVSFNSSKPFTFGEDYNKNYEDLKASNKSKDINERIMLRNYNLKIIKNSFELINKRKKDLNSSFSRKDDNQKFKVEENKEKKNKKVENIKDNVIELSIIETTNTKNASSHNKKRKKHGKFIDIDEKDSLSFKDEKELVDYLNKKYEKDKIIDLFKIEIKDKEKEKLKKN